jgi:hypothetical protein
MAIPSGKGAMSSRDHWPRTDAGPLRPDEPGAPQQSTAHPETAPVIRIYYEDLFPEDVTVLDGIPVTKPARTLLDLATVCDDRELRDALTESLKRGLTNRSQILAVIARYPRHRGGPRLKTMMEAWSGRQRS